MRQEFQAVFGCMAAQLSDLDPPHLLPCVSSDKLRDNLSESINRAAFGTEPVLVMRRGRKIAAIVSMDDLTFLEKMKQRRDEAMRERLPTEQSGIGPAIAQRVYWELFFG